MSISIEVKAGDALSEQGDVLILKHAQALYGVDEAVMARFHAAHRLVQLPKPWGFRLEDSVPGIAASRVLFIGVPQLREFGYAEIRRFARQALIALAGKAPETRDILLTVHGPGYGLDEIEAFGAEVAGLVDAVHNQDCPERLRKITIVERNAGRATRLTSALSELLPDDVIGAAHSPQTTRASEKLQSAGYKSDAKAHVFVAMPFKEDMDDVYHYGIQSAVNAAGFLCERADLSIFTGDVLEWVRARIRSASFVVADLTDANPNVYLEVGYAWGVEVPTVLLVRDVDHLKFDVRSHRCLVYKKIQDLEESLTSELEKLGRP
jgi:hypothetical protein